MKELKSYLVKFEKNGAMKFKVYLSDCVVGGNNWWLVIIITYDKYIFLANKRI